MKRRDFLKAVLAAPAAAVIPRWLEPLPVWGKSLVSILAPLQREINQEYYSVVIHPDCWLDVRRSQMRWTWYVEYTEWRKLRRQGEPIETLREVMERVRDEVDALATNLHRGTKKGEFGSYEGFRFVESKTVAPFAMPA